MLRRITIGCLAVLLTGLAAPARADLSIYVQDTTVAPGGFGYLNIYLAGASTDQFDNYQVTLSISQINPANPGAPDIVNFAPNDLNGPAFATSGEQPYSYLYPPGWTSSNPTTAPNYIFPNDSLDSSGPYNGGYQPIGYNSTYFTITDLALLSDYAPASGSAPTLATPGTLLGSLLIHASATNLGDEFSVSLVSDGTESVNDATFFQNSSGDTVTYSQPLSTSPAFTGTITIGPSVTGIVPEPASTITSLTGAALFAAYGWLRLRHPKRQAD